MEDVKARMGFFIDERSDAQQREALQVVFTGQAGGWPAGFASKIGETRGVEFVPITFEVAEELAFWRAEIPGRVVGRAEALSGPTNRRANASKPSIRLARKLDPDRLPPGAVRPNYATKDLASSGRGITGRASIFRSIGPAGAPPRSRVTASSTE
jgi:hypothetical protein